MKHFTKILMLAIALVASTGSVMAQDTVDMSIFAGTSNPLAKLDAEPKDFFIFVNTEALKEATGVTVTATLPEGVKPESVVVSESSQPYSCAFANNFSVCNFPKLGVKGAISHEFAAVIEIKLAQGTSGAVTLLANIAANEADNNLANNSSSVTATFPPPVSIMLSPKNRKRARFF
jgi:hypothetical protein